MAYSSHYISIVFPTQVSLIVIAFQVWIPDQAEVWKLAGIVQEDATEV